MDYSKLSKDLTKNLDKDIKKSNGIFFTPPSCIKNTLKILEPYINEINELQPKKIFNILEPSCGSCEYINGLINHLSNSKYNNYKITGVEYNIKIYEKIKNLYNDRKKYGNKIEIANEDFMSFNTNNLHGIYDLIIGNPPFFVMKKENIDKKYYDYLYGRPNIFILFIIKSIKLLKNGGILSFILPKNFINCTYYNKTREFINKNTQIIDIIECHEEYIETQQSTILFIIKKIDDSKNIDNTPFIFKNTQFTIFNTKDKIKKLHSIYKNYKTLNELGFYVSVGNIVWNQNKDYLKDTIYTIDKDTKTINTRLIYSSDIKNNKLEFSKFKDLVKNKKSGKPEENTKKHYIDLSSDKKINNKATNEIMLLINRGYGTGEYKLNYYLINENNNIMYVVENHILCIKKNKEIIKNIKKTQLIKEYKQIISSLKNKKTKEFINLYFGNGGINTAEMNHILPIFEIEKKKVNNMVFNVLK